MKTREVINTEWLVVTCGVRSHSCQSDDTMSVCVLVNRELLIISVHVCVHVKCVCVRHVKANYEECVFSCAFIRLSGEPDFWIGDDLNWAFEILVRGKKGGPHVNRFRHGGTYAALSPAAIRVVDFRPPAPPDPPSPSTPSDDDSSDGYHAVPAGPHADIHVTVLLAEDFQTATVCFPATGRRDVIRFTGRPPNDWL